MADIFVAKYARLGAGFSRREQLDANVHPGRRVDGSQTAASWVTDLADLKKIILLCSFCRGKFNPRRNSYRRMWIADPTGKTDGYSANGQCDACKQPTVNAGGGTAYVHESTYQMVNQDPVEVRRRARMKSTSAWRA